MYPFPLVHAYNFILLHAFLFSVNKYNWIQQTNSSLDQNRMDDKDLHSQLNSLKQEFK